MSSAQQVLAVPGVKAAGQRDKLSWSLEVFIPYSELKITEIPLPGTVWYGNFIRNQTTTGTLRLQRWSTLYSRSNHDFAAFGQLKFVE